MPHPPSALPPHIIDTTTTPTQLDLSPSKARAHALQTHTWALVDGWLAGLWAPEAVPAFERNAETLEALRAVMRENERVEARRGLWEDDLEEVHDDESVSEGVEMVLLRDLEACLGVDVQERLRALAEASVLLGYMPLQSDAVEAFGLTGVLGQRIMGVTARTFALENLVAEVEALRAQLELEMEATRAAVEVLKGRDGLGVDGVEALVGQTARWARETKVIGVKLAEYKERIAGLEAARDQEGPGVTIEQVGERERQLDDRKSEVRMLERRLVEFHGLPPDVEASRAEVRRAQAELVELKEQRNKLFQEMSEG